MNSVRACKRCGKVGDLFDDLYRCLDAEDDAEAMRQVLGKEAQRWIQDLIK